MDARAWLESYGLAWRTKDDRALAELFTPDGMHRSSPLREPHVGREAIRSYWREATSDQEDLHLQFGEPIVMDDRVAVEWWATMIDRTWAAEHDAPNPELTLPGCLILRFNAEGLCEELREYWHVEFGGRVSPPEGWGW
ncbi:MAG: nuclear transport factor 2 family protein [Chloroflexota bacterium]